jgi:exonuclease SbcC
MQLDLSSVNRIFDELVGKLQSLSKEYTKVANDNPLSEVELQNLEENRKYLKVLIDNSNNELLNNFEQKKLLLRWYLSKSQFEIHSKETKKFNESFPRLKELYIRSKKVKKLLECVKSAKNQYMNDLIRYIEIPLYIYSGKLMQTHQNGLGVFCTTGSSEDRVTQFKLTINGDISGHDIINKFSSGQKAVMNIAVILAFRKIRVASLDLFMIDDPCQSMDDINIASLTEILRNEFRKTQILISTHDDSTAGYMCYKYFKSGKNYRNLNVQKEFYTIEAD